MGQIDIGAIYTTAITVSVIIAITSFNLVTLDKSKTPFFVVFARLNEFFVILSAIYFIMFTYEALDNYAQFVISKVSYDKYTILFSMYYGGAQIAILLMYKLFKFVGRNNRLIKK